MTKSVKLRITSSGHVMLANPLAPPAADVVEITAVPGDMQPAAVAKQFAKVSVWPPRAALDWSQIDGKAQGAIIR